MRTTLTIDDDILRAAREMATNGLTIGEVVSNLARKGLYPDLGETPSYRNGIRLMPVGKRNRAVTTETVNQLRDEIE